MTERDRKTMINERTYVKNGLSVISFDRFVYVSELFGYYEGSFSLLKKEYFVADKEIPNVVSSFWKTKNLQICGELYAAPEKWLIENGWEKYSPPIKKPKKIKENEK